jgi:hypothetical protein
MADYPFYVAGDISKFERFLYAFDHLSSRNLAAFELFRTLT